jgi:hypothetical protein
VSPSANARGQPAGNDQSASLLIYPHSHADSQAWIAIRSKSASNPKNHRHGVKSWPAPAYEVPALRTRRRQGPERCPGSGRSGSAHRR